MFWLYQIPKQDNTDWIKENEKILVRNTRKNKDKLTKIMQNNIMIEK